MARRFRVGLTGGIACGKSTVANLFAALGASIVDTDLLAREVVAPGSPLLPQIAAHFGLQVLQEDGSLDRAALRDLVFASPAERQWLEQLTHPAIRELTDLRCETATGKYVIVAIPLLVETGGADRFDRVLVVDCQPELQLARLQARDGMTRAQAERMLAAQASREKRLAVADDVVRNDGDLATLRNQVEKLHRRYLSAAAAQAEGAAT
ncbi:MAG TPA: dephospho-CoA kinase [Steroidobacteraceae bacterium]|nr:dephospho-CoA kinase [Steroidobacteraceae bacterium]